MHGPGEPSAWVQRFLAGIRPGGSVLDIAAGGGRHTIEALARGFLVTAVDRDVSGLADVAGSETLRIVKADLEDGTPFPFQGERFDGVIVTNYLWRAILPDIVACVSDDGILIYETFALGHERHGRPSRPDFLLKPNELIEAVLPQLVVVAYEHGEIAGDHPRIVQRIAACGRHHQWAGETLNEIS